MFCFPVASVFAGLPAKETITYDISPIGNSVYRDYGKTEFRGKVLNLTVFETHVAGFSDTERIYSEPDTGLPVWIERDITQWFGKEYITEDYDLTGFKVLIKKFKDAKLVQEYRFSAKGPIGNAILVPFSLRSKKDLQVGWSTEIRLPQEFKMRLSSIEEVNVPAGRFKAYHFTSTPAKFEIWISADSQRLPVKIKGLGGIPYALVMSTRSVLQDK